MVGPLGPQDRAAVLARVIGRRRRTILYVLAKADAQRAEVMEIIDEVRQIIAKALKVPVDKVTPEMRLDELGAESLDVIEIVF